MSFILKNSIIDFFHFQHFGDLRKGRKLGFVKSSLSFNANSNYKREFSFESFPSKWWNKLISMRNRWNKFKGLFNQTKRWNYISHLPPVHSVYENAFFHPITDFWIFSGNWTIFISCWKKLPISIQSLQNVYIPDCNFAVIRDRLEQPFNSSFESFRRSSHFVRNFDISLKIFHWLFFGIFLKICEKSKSLNIEIWLEGKRGSGREYENAPKM